MEKPITYYEESLRYARKERAPICHTEHGELIAMVKARDSKNIENREALATWMLRQSFSTGHGDTIQDLLLELSSQIPSNDSLVAKNVTIQTQLDQQLCITRTLEKEIAELKQDNERMDWLEKQFLLAAYQPDVGECFHLWPGVRPKSTVRNSIDVAIASQQGGEVK